MNAPRGDISAEQRWADDLLDASRLYRQDAVDAGEQSVAAILDDLERSLIEIVNSPSKISAADLEQIRRRIDAASLLFKVRVMSDELRQARRRAGPLDPAIVNINTSHQLTIMDTTRLLLSSMFVAALAVPAAAQPRRAGRAGIPAMPTIPMMPAMPAMPPSMPAAVLPRDRCGRCRCALAIAGSARVRRRPRRRSLRPGARPDRAGQVRSRRLGARSADRAQEQPHRRGDVLEGLQPVEARASAPRRSPR